MKTPEDFSINLAYSYERPEDLARYYNDSASQYDDYVSEVSYILHLRVAAEYTMSSNGDDSVLDIGCGTGLLGQAISNILPLTKVDGVDISPGMLEIAKTKTKTSDKSNSYRNLFKHDVTKDMNFTDEKYDAIVSSGVFTKGHLFPGDMWRVMEPLKVGGFFVSSIKKDHFETSQFDTTIRDLHQEQKITISKMIEVNSYDSRYEAPSIIVVFQKCA